MGDWAKKQWRKKALEKELKEAFKNAPKEREDYLARKFLNKWIAFTHRPDSKKIKALGRKYNKPKRTISGYFRK